MTHLTKTAAAFALSMASSVSFALDSVEVANENTTEKQKHTIQAKTICMDGFLFAVAYSGHSSRSGYSVSIEQVYKKGKWNDSPAYPVTCGAED